MKRNNVLHLVHFAPSHMLFKIGISWATRIIMLLVNQIYTWLKCLNLFVFFSVYAWSAEIILEYIIYRPTCSLNTVLAKVQQKAFPLAEFLDSAIFLGELFFKINFALRLIWVNRQPILDWFKSRHYRCSWSYTCSPKFQYSGNHYPVHSVPYNYAFWCRNTFTTDSMCHFLFDVLFAYSWNLTRRVAIQFNFIFLSLHCNFLTPFSK